RLQRRRPFGDGGSALDDGAGRAGQDHRLVRQRDWLRHAPLRAHALRRAKGPLTRGRSLMIKSIAELPIEGRRVFIRVDFNVPLTPAQGVAADSRIVASLPTIKHAIERGARVVLASHLGRPKGPTPSLSLEPVGARLAELLGKEVFLTDEAVGDGARKV